MTVLLKQQTERLDKLETLLSRARDILALSNREFRNVFGFSTDLLTTDPEKVHDILAEPFLVVNLSEYGFSKLTKLPRFIKKEVHRLSVSDFIGERTGKKFAIELKTIRTENNPKPHPGEFIGNNRPNWWGMMLRNNIITKIEYKNRKVIKQLINTKNYKGCDYTMLALYTRRLGPSTLMGNKDSENELAEIKDKYKEIDYIFLINYFGEMIIYPQLGT